MSERRSAEDIRRERLFAKARKLSNVTMELTQAVAKDAIGMSPAKFDRETVKLFEPVEQMLLALKAEYFRPEKKENKKDD